ATSALGLARAMAEDPKVKQIIYQIQQELYLLMGELATPPENYEKMGLRMTIEHVKRLEQVEEQLKQEVEIPNKFIIPGDSLDGAALDLARTIIRRAERMAVKLLHDGVIENSEVIRYLNRLSDLVFILARYIEVKSSLAQRPECKSFSKGNYCDRSAYYLGSFCNWYAASVGRVVRSLSDYNQAS